MRLSMNYMTYARLYVSPDGESHFTDAQMEFALADYVSNAPPLGLSAIQNANHSRLLKAPAGWASDWHPSSARNLFVVLSGEWEVTASDGETRCFCVGSVLLVEDTNGKGHRSRVVSDVDSVALMVELNEKKSHR